MKETYDQWYEWREWIKAQPDDSTHVQNYPKWLDEGGRSIALREKVEDHLRVSGEMSPKRES